MASFLRLSPALLVLVAACGGGGEATLSPAKTPSDEKAAAAKAPVVPRKITALKRAEVKEAIQIGLGYFLQNVSVEDFPAMQDGKFHGFVVRSINEAWIVDLKPGDVVTRVNGIVPEQPDDADSAFKSLEKATALKVDYERNGQRRTLELPIVD